MGIELRALKLLSIEGIGHKQHVLMLKHMLLIFHDGPGRAVAVVGPVSSLSWSWGPFIKETKESYTNLARLFVAFRGCLSKNP